MDVVFRTRHIAAGGRSVIRQVRRWSFIGFWGGHYLLLRINRYFVDVSFMLRCVSGGWKWLLAVTKSQQLLER